MTCPKIIFKYLVKMTTPIPYVIQFAHPDYKRPYLSIVYGKADTIADARSQIESHIYNYIVDYFGEEQLLKGLIKSYDDIEKFIYAEFYMDNAVIHVRIFEDNTWKTLQIDYPEYLERMCHQKK